jgi:hypothetical protein
VADSYKVLTVMHLPVIEVDKRPGDTVTAEELEQAGQSEEQIASMVEAGSLGGADDPINPAHIIPDANMPTIGSVVANAQSLVSQLEAAGEEVPDEIRALAGLDYEPAKLVAGNDTASGGDAHA